MSKLTIESWCAALESGNYTQTKGRLRRFTSAGGVNHCCLGVACDLYDPSKRQGDTYYLSPKKDYQSFLPKEIQDHLNLATNDGMFDPLSLPTELRTKLAIGPDGHPPSSLIGANDCGIPFPLIAQIIKAKPLGLFKD